MIVEISLDEYQLSTFEIEVGGERTIVTGYVLAEPNKLIKLAQFKDWSFAGLLVFRVSDADRLPDDPNSEFYREALAYLKPLSIAIRAGVVKAGTFKEVFEVAMRSKTLLSIEGKHSDEYEILSVHGVSDGGALAKTLEGDGSWSETALRINFDNLALVTMHDPYCEGLQKYLEVKG